MSDVKRTDDIQGDIIHEYDGIEEADNDLPRWWLFIFYASIAFAVFYWFYYQEFEAGQSPEQEYAAALRARAGDEVSGELLTLLSQDEEAVSAGRQLFETNCVACHAQDASGQIGPNLTDPYWIHGGAPMDIYHTVENGVLDKGMPPWGGPLGPKGMKNVVAYVLSIRDQNLPGKEPQGELWQGGEQAAGGGGEAAAGGEQPGAGDQPPSGAAATADGGAAGGAPGATEPPAGDGSEATPTPEDPGRAQP